MTFFHPIVEECLYVLGLQAAELIHKQVETVITAGTTVQYANGKTARTALGASDTIDTDEIVKATRTLRKNSGQTFDGYYVAVIHPDVEHDLLKDTNFVTAVRTAAAERLYKGELGRLYGVVFVRSEAITSFSSTVTVWPTFVFAQYAFAMTYLQDLQVYHHAPGSAGTSDPVNQLRTLGWKCSFKAVILNNNWLLRIETAAS